MRYEIKANKSISKKESSYQVEAISGIYDGNALIGKTVQFPVIVQKFTYRVRKDGDFQDKVFEQYQLPDTTLIDSSMQKNIVVTSIQGRNGTVKELISNSDYRVRMRGTLAGNGQEYPYEAVAKMKELAGLPAAFPVSGWLFEVLGISYLVVESLEFPTVAGQGNTQGFVLNCISDNVPDIQLVAQYEGL